MRISLHRRWLVAVPLIAFAGLAMALSKGRGTSCERVVLVTLHNREDPAAILDKLSGCSFPERKEVYFRLSPAERIALWHSHLASFLREGSHLNSSQAATLRLFMSRLATYLSSNGDGKAALQRDGFSARALRAEFGDSLGKAIFAILGKDLRRDGHTTGETVAYIGPDGRAMLTESHSRSDAQPLKTLPYCNCSQSSDWCCQGTCGTNSSDCITSSMGCGTLWLYRCNGLCESPQ
jgi:hypothetical protein